MTSQKNVCVGGYLSQPQRNTSKLPNFCSLVLCIVTPRSIGLFLVCFLRELLGTLSRPRRQRQRKRGKTEGLMSRTMALHIHIKTLYVSQPFSEKQQREITTVVLRI